MGEVKQGSGVRMSKVWALSGTGLYLRQGERETKSVHVCASLTKIGHPHMIFFKVYFMCVCLVPEEASIGH